MRETVGNLISPVKTLSPLGDVIYTEYLSLFEQHKQAWMFYPRVNKKIRELDPRSFKPMGAEEEVLSRHTCIVSVETSDDWRDLLFWNEWRTEPLAAYIVAKSEGKGWKLITKPDVQWKKTESLCCQSSAETQILMINYFQQDFVHVERQKRRHDFISAVNSSLCVGKHLARFYHRNQRLPFGLFNMC